MVAALPSPSAGAQQHQVFHQQSEEENGRHPLALAEKNNGEVVRKPRSREITSRYKSTTPTPPASTTPSSSARRFPSPVIGRSSNGLEAPKRAVSAERRRPDSPAPGSSTDSKASTSRPGTPRAASRASGNADGVRSSQRLWPAAHNLSASLQVDSISRLTNGRAEGKDKPERGQASDHTLKPAANGLHRASDSTGGPRKLTPERKGTPERKRTPVRRPATDQAENAKPVDNSSVKPDVHRWPVTNSPKAFGAAMSRSVDLSSDKEKPGNRIAGLMVQGRAMSGATRPGRHTPPIRSLTRSINEGPLPDSPQSVSRHMLSESRGRGKLELQNGGHSPSQEILNGAMQQVADWVRQSPDEAELASSEGQPSVDNISDCDSISSGGSGATTVVSSGSGKKGTPGRRVNQDLAGRTRRLSEGDKVRSSLPEQEFSAAVASVGKASRRLKSLSISGGSPSTGVWSLSPGRFSSTSQPPSPSRMLQVSSPFRSMPSPTRTRVSSFQLPPNNRPSSVSSLLNFPIDVRKGKKAMSQQEEAQYLRILHNRWLQWCLVNARAEAARNSQKATAERSIYNAWLQTSELRKSVAMKRIKLQQARQARKLQLILSSQGPQLENWAALQQEHSAALSGAMEALEAAVLRVPVTGGARADVQAIREALGFAVDVMGSVESSARSLMPRAERMHGLVSELAEVTSQEKALLEDCSVCLDRIAALEIEERSIRTHFVQLESEQGRNSSNRGDPVPQRTPTRTC